jgi:hypothetical protein
MAMRLRFKVDELAQKLAWSKENVLTVLEKIDPMLLDEASLIVQARSDRQRIRDVAIALLAWKHCEQVPDE